MSGYIGGNPSINQEEDYRENLTKNITYELDNEKFKDHSRDGLKGVFIRDRKLTIRNLIIMIINFKSSIQRELDRFFKILNNSNYDIREVTKGAFSQARVKLNPLSFKWLNEISVKTFYEGANYYLWHSLRVLAVDGSRLLLPNHSSIVQEFGRHSFGPNADSPRSMALCSMLYDVLNLVTLDSQIAPYSGSERDLLMEHLSKVKPGDLLLLDRGYPCIWLLFLLKAMGIEFCVRMKESWWKKIKKFAKSDDIDQIVSFTLPKKDYKKLSQYPHMQQETIECRLVKVILPNGEKEILCTSLLDKETYQYDEFGELYHCRWDEEEAYKLLKSRIELENFSGKTATAVKQDFYAKVFLMTLCAAYSHPVEMKVREEYKADAVRKYDQKINRTNAISMTQNIIQILFCRKERKDIIKKGLKAFDKVVEATREIIRPGRSNKRNHKPKKLYSMVYKRL